MIVNMNYSLLMEGAENSFALPKYNPIDRFVDFSEAAAIEMITEFNQVVKEQDQVLAEAYEIEYSIREASVTVEICNAVKTAISKVKEALKKLWRFIIDGIKKLIAKIEDLIKSRKDPMEKYSAHERNRLLSKALKNLSKESKIIKVCEIEPSADLLDLSYPDFSVLDNKRLLSDVQQLDSIFKNIQYKDGTGDQLLDAEKDSAEKLASAIEEDRLSLLQMVFGKYDFDPTNIMQSAKEVSEKAFGTNELKDTEITLDLYGQAYDNIEKMGKLKKDLQKKADEFTKSYRKIDDQLTEFEKALSRLDRQSNPKVDVDLKASQHAIQRQIIPNVRRCFNVIQSVVSATQTIFANKMARFGMILTGSDMIRRKANNLIKASIGLEEEFSGKDEVQEFYQMQEEFEASIALIQEALMESAFDDEFYKVLNEAEGKEAAAADAKPGLGDKIFEFVDKMVQKLDELFPKFTARASQLINKAWWDKHRANIANLDLSDTTVTDWYNYNEDNLAQSTYVKFDPNNDAFKNDQATQKAILAKLNSNNVNIKEDDKFGTKLNQLYQTSYVKKDDTPVKVGDLNQKAMFAYVDDFINKGFDGNTGALATIKADYNAIKEDQAQIKRNYQTYLDQLKIDDAADMKVEQKAATTTTEPQNNNESTIEDDFRFNLAECFSLNNKHEIDLLHEVEVNTGAASQASIAANGGKAPVDKKTAELRARINRCFRYNTIAVTAKMTAALGAYKQYLGLYKAVYKTPGEDANAPKEGEAKVETKVETKEQK